MAVNVTLLNSNSKNNIQTNFERIQAALQNAVSRDGTLPNSISADLDLNSNDLLNVGLLDVEEFTLDGVSITDSINNAIEASVIAMTAAANALSSEASAAASEENAALSANAAALWEELAQQWAEDAFEISTGVVLASTAEALEGVSTAKAMTPKRVMEVLASTMDFIPIRTLDATVGTGGADDTVALQAAIDAAFALGKGLDLSGLDFNVMAPIVLRTSLKSSHPSSNGSMIRANTGFVGNYLIDMYANPNPGRHGTLVQGIRFSGGSNDINTISTSSPFGGGGTNITYWKECHFSNISDTKYCMQADSSGSEGGGTFTGHIFDNCYWFSPLPWYIGDNQDDITFISPRVQLVNATAPTKAPFVTTGNNIVFGGAMFLSLDDGGKYTVTTMWQIGNGTVDIGAVFIEDDDVTGHHFPSFFGLYGARAMFFVGPIRLNDEYTGAGSNCVIRWNMGGSDTGNKEIHLRGVTSRGAPLSVRPDFLFGCFTSSGLSVPNKYADVYFTANDEYDADSLIYSVGSSAGAQGYRSRLHGWVNGVQIERAYQIASGGATPARRDLRAFNESNTANITVDVNLTVRPGITILNNTSGSTKSIGLTPFNAEDHIKIGTVYYFTNPVGSSVTIRNSYVGGQAIAVGGGGTLKTVAVGASASFMWRGDKFIELVDPA